MTNTLLGDSIVVSPTEPIGNDRKKVWFKWSNNLFDKDNTLDGYEINSATGGVQVNSAWFISDYIKVNQNDKIFLSGKSIGNSNCFYDRNKKYLGKVDLNSGLITVPDNSSICYLRFNGLLTEKDNIMLEYGTSRTEYQPYVEPQIFIKNSNDVYEKFTDNSTKNLTFTKNEANNIYYYNIYATENEVQISADIRYNFAKGTKIKVLTIEKGYEAIIPTADKIIRFSIGTDSETGTTGYADVNDKGEVYVSTLGAAKAAYINIRYRYK